MVIHALQIISIFQTDQNTRGNVFFAIVTIHPTIELICFKCAYENVNIFVLIRGFALSKYIQLTLYPCCKLIILSIGKERMHVSQEDTCHSRFYDKEIFCIELISV